MGIPGRAFNRLCFIQYHVLPLDTLEVLDILNDELVACNHHVERRFLHVHVLLAPELTKDPAILSVAPVWNHLCTAVAMSSSKMYTDSDKFQT